MQSPLAWFEEQTAKRPWWMNLMLAFCAFMTFVYMPWDIFVKPVGQDEEVWFGVLFHGAAAKLLAIPHWLIYAAGCLGFYRMRGWMWPWAAVYLGQVVIAMFMWPVLYGDGAGRFLLGLVSASFFAIPCLALWRAKSLFEGVRERSSQRYGEWALVTGASAGIGEAFAEALAEAGHSLVLAARREERLEALAERLRERFGIEVRVAAADLSREDEMARLLESVADLEIAVLVNNAGVGYAGRFDGQDDRRLADLVKLNCLAPVVLAAGLIPGMKARGRGALVFVGSVAGAQPLPLHAVYAASKAFDNLLGEALWGELRGSGIDCLSVQPGTTETEFAEGADQTAHPGASARVVVSDALEALGEQPSVISGWFNWLRANAGARLLPRSFLTMAGGKVMERRTPSNRH